MTTLVELELTQQDVRILLSGIKQAESAYTEDGRYKACKEVSELYAKLYKQVFTYGQYEGA